MNPLSRLLLTLLIGIAIGGASAWKVQNWRMEAAEGKRAQLAHEQFRRDERRAASASAGFEKSRSANETRYRTVTVEVEKIVERPVYGAACLDDDGLRVLNEQIRRADPGQPGLKLPGPQDAGGQGRQIRAPLVERDGQAVPGLPGPG